MAKLRSHRHSLVIAMPIDLLPGIPNVSCVAVLLSITSWARVSKTSGVIFPYHALLFLTLPHLVHASPRFRLFMFPILLPPKHARARPILCAQTFEVNIGSTAPHLSTTTAQLLD